MDSSPEDLRECDVPSSTKDEIMCLGYPSLENIFEKYSYMMSYNLNRKVANWVLEYLTPAQRHGFYLSRGDATEFKEDRDIKGVASLDDCTGWQENNYERGHLAAAGNHKYNRKAYSSTFLTSNIVPMYKEVNNVLRRIEEKGRKLVRDYGDTHIITGPIFRPERLEPIFVKKGCQVQVPDAIFKIFTYKKGNRREVTGYVVENSLDVDKNIDTSRETLLKIRHLTGLNFLSEVPEENIVETRFGSRRSAGR